MRTGQVARQAGLNVQTLRYYERRGLIPEPARSPGGHRAYPPETVGLLRAIKAAQRLGFTLDEVAELLHAGRGPGRARSGLRRHAAAKLGQVDARIKDLLAVRDTLATVVTAGCDDLTDCSSPACPLPGAGRTGPAGGR